ncbi:MAG: L,D-transpeptidase family protein [Candidatus Zixiibacteriota bacterium]
MRIAAGAVEAGGARLDLHRNQRREGLSFKFRLTLLATVGTIALAAIALLVWPVPDPPPASLENARSAIHRAAEAGALRYAQATYGSAERLLNDGWVEMGRQKGRLAPFRNYRAADSLLGLAVQTAHRAADESISRIGYLDSLARIQQGELEGEIVIWREALDGSLVKLKAQRYLSSAILSLETSWLLIDQKDYEEALLAGAKGRKSLGELGDMLAEYSNDEAQKMDTWRGWVEETLAESRKKGTYAVIVDKSAHKTYLVKSGELVHTYDCELGYNSAHNKLFEGDGATPEGRYRIISVKPRGSKYYKAVLLDYPNASDRRRFDRNKRKGIISPKARIGGFIEIHGEGGKDRDWTEGCVALSNSDMDQLMRYVTMGTPVTIVRRSDRWP